MPDIRTKKMNFVIKKITKEENIMRKGKSKSKRFRMEIRRKFRNYSWKTVLFTITWKKTF